MTISKVADRGIRTSTSGGDATVTLTDPTDIKVGNYLVARVAVDNSGTSGALPGLAVTDTPGNTWTVGTGALNDPGAASAGMSAYLCYCRINTAYAAAATVLFDYTTGSPLSAIVIEEWTGIDYITPAAVAQTTATSSTTTITISRTPSAAGQLMYVMSAIEGFSTDWGAQDADSTNGTWTALTKDQANTGTATTSVSVYGGYKVVNASGAQTWDNTLGTARDSASVAIVFGAGAQSALWVATGATAAEDPSPGSFGAYHVITVGTTPASGGGGGATPRRRVHPKPLRKVGHPMYPH